jgi:hypothetical protein
MFLFCSKKNRAAHHGLSRGTALYSCGKAAFRRAKPWNVLRAPVPRGPPRGYDFPSFHSGSPHSGKSAIHNPRSAPQVSEYGLWVRRLGSASE